MPAAEGAKSKQAAKEQIEALHKNRGWILTKRPPGNKANGCKWIFKEQKGEDGKVERHNARLIAKCGEEMKKPSLQL